MGCGCGQKAADFKFVYTNAGGQTTTYNTEIEAKAAVIRGGGSYQTVAR